MNWRQLRFIRSVPGTENSLFYVNGQQNGNKYEISGNTSRISGNISAILDFISDKRYNNAEWRYSLTWQGENIFLAEKRLLF